MYVCVLSLQKYPDRLASQTLSAFTAINSGQGRKEGDTNEGGHSIRSTRRQSGSLWCLPLADANDANTGQTECKQF